MAIIKWKTKQEIEDENNQPRELTEIELLKIEQAKANTELFEMMLTLQGGM